MTKRPRNTHRHLKKALADIKRQIRQAEDQRTIASKSGVVDKWLRTKLTILKSDQEHIEQQIKAYER